SRAIERLLKNGVITKRLSQKDKRSSLIALSKDGKAMYGQIIPRVVEWQNKRLENITDDEYRVFLKVIDALTP
ncbi:MAG: MarR family transcriptional regulator, partial [Rhodobacteraceae bacterium TMED111]